MSGARGVPVVDLQQPDGNETERWAGTALHLARRFHAGATLWCAAPEWPWHADHVAVEFVHPVIVGKKALPAVALRSADWPDALRSRSRPGDVFLAIGRADHPDLERAARRAPVWGLSTVWLEPAGSRSGPEPGGFPSGPEPGRSPSGPNHIRVANYLRVSGADPAYGGELVRAYHVLWELTHVCFEHPGLLEDPDACVVDGHCITCSDEGRLAEILELRPGDHAAVRSAAGVEDVDTTLVTGARPGDVVLVHAGTAISAVSEAELGVA